MQTAFQPKTIVTAVAFALLSASAVQAADTVKTEDVKVTASRVEKELSDVNMTVSVITAEEIKHSSARNVGELLENIPGIEVNSDGGQGMKRIKIRGENAFRTVVMIDGQKVAEHKSMSGSPMLIDPAMIERIEVIKGPASVLYGSDSIGGAINIITKKGGDKAFEGTVSAGYNTSADGVNAAASLFGASNGWKYRFNVAYEDDKELDTPKGEMYNTGFNSKAANLFVSYDINPDATVGMSLDAYDLEFHSGDMTTPGFRVDVDKWERSKVAAFGEFRNVTDNLVRVRTDAFYQNSKKEMLNTVPDMMPDFAQGGFPPSPGQRPVFVPVKIYPQADNELDQYGFSVQTDWQLGEKHYLVAGYEMSYDDLSSTSITDATFTPKLPFPDPHTPSRLSNYSHDGYQMSNAVYASMDSMLTDDVILNYGVRYTWVESDMDMVDHKTGKKTSNDSSDGKAVFNAGILWNGIENLTLRANYSQGYRNPILQELYIDTSMGTGNPTYSNPDLKPETSDNFELGARWSNGMASIDAAVFYNDAEDYIAVLKTGSVDRYENVAKAKSYGLEVAASAYLGETGFEPYVNLTMMKRQYDNGAKSTWDTGTPLVTAVYGIRWAGEQNGLNVRWDAFLRSQSESEYEDLDATARSGGSYCYAGFTTFNLKGGIDFGADKQYSVDFGLYNVFDKLYQTQGAIYEPGRYAAVKFNAAF